MSKPKKPAKLAPHQLTAKAQGLAQPQEGGSFIRHPVTKDLVKQEPPVEPAAPAAPPVDPTTTDTSDTANGGASQQGN